MAEVSKKRSWFKNVMALMLSSYILMIGVEIVVSDIYIKLFSPEVDSLYARNVLYESLFLIIFALSIAVPIEILFHFCSKISNIQKVWYIKYLMSLVSSYFTVIWWLAEWHLVKIPEYFPRLF